MRIMGSCFKPFVPKRLHDRIDQKCGRNERSTKMKKALIVDDHDDIRKLIRLTLDFEDFEIHEAGSGKEALALVESVKPDVMLLDVMMPGGVDGLEVCASVKANGALQQTKIVMLSAKGSKADIDRGKAAGCDAYLVKPFSPLNLIQTISALR
jgi:CheY-like chemotaxis protein